jgi:hypothetical protein
METVKRGGGIALRPIERRAYELAEEMVNFCRPRLLTSQIPGLAHMLVVFAEGEIKRCRTDPDGGLGSESAHGR